MKLSLGYLDVPYVDQGGVTTGDVGEILEAKYHIVEHFTELHGEEIGDLLTDAAEKALENVLMGAPPSQEPLIGGFSKIEDSFRNMLITGELEHIGYPGIPTQASIDRRSGKKSSARFKRRRAGKKSLTGPSFIETGLLNTSFRMWSE